MTPPAPKQYVLIAHIADFGDTNTGGHHYWTRDDLIDMIESMEMMAGAKLVRYALVDDTAGIVANEIRDLLPES